MTMPSVPATAAPSDDLKPPAEEKNIEWNVSNGVHTRAS